MIGRGIPSIQSKKPLPKPMASSNVADHQCTTQERVPSRERHGRWGVWHHMRTWRASFREAIRANPKLSATLAFELGLLCYATLKARTGKHAGVPPAATIIDAVPIMAAAALAAPAAAGPKKRRGKGMR